MRFGIWGLITLGGIGVAAADPYGNPTSASYACGDNALSSIVKVCQAVSSVFPGVNCNISQGSCVQAKQEIFTGLTGETASPTNIKAWNGQGVSGKLMQTTGLCLARDLASAPMQSKATASLPIGTISVKNIVGYRSFDYNSGQFKGYQRLSMVAPVIGEVDLTTQDFALRSVSSSLAGQGKKVGEYAVDGAHALELEARGGAESFGFEIDAIKVTTPYGTVTPKPYLTMGRLTGWSLSPYGGAAASLRNPGAFQVRDVYGRISGQAIASGIKVLGTPPAGGKSLYCNPTIANGCVGPTPGGWMSLATLGSRDVRSDVPPWKAPAGTLFPLRPDTDPTKARSDLEKAPNAYAKAGVKVEYDPTGMIPAEILANAPVVLTAKVFVDPNIQVAGGGSFNMISTQLSTVNPALVKPGSMPGTPVDVESQHFVGYNSGASVFGRFALDAGVDITMRLVISLPWPFDDIDITVLDVHPRTSFLEKTTGDAKAAPASTYASLNAQEAVKTGKLFQTFLALGGATDATAYLQACVAQPAPPAAEPPPPGYKKGDPNDLVKVIDLPCNICIGMPDTPWVGKKKDPNAVYPGPTPKGVAKGFAFKYKPVDDSGLPASQRWTCGGEVPSSSATLAKAPASANPYLNKIKNAGCYDQCRVDQSTGQFTIVESAKSLYAKGVMKNAPNGCY
ncbi:MAG: hypothetical protein K2Q06_06445 [Parvularculaceae bacterium]|nr:hypothetical protein [Parvularculaceae bacterium]